jgi:hypothetical protein
VEVLVGKMDRIRSERDEEDEGEERKGLGGIGAGGEGKIRTNGKRRVDQGGMMARREGKGRC